MLYHPPTPLPSIDQLELGLRTKNVHALKKALTEYGLVDDFADYLINIFTNTPRSADSITDAHALVELMQEFGANRDQQLAVMKMLPQRWSQRLHEKN